MKKSIILFLICCLAAFSSVMIYFSYTDRAETAVPVIITLSDEQLMGLGYTAASAPNNDNIWDDDDFSYSVRSAKTEPVSEASVSFPVDINAATAEELMSIKGIGSATAENIISYRNEHGYFHSADDLLNVDGIGSKKLADIKDYIYISPEIAAEASETTEVSADIFYENSSESISPGSRTETITVPDNAEASDETVFPIDLNTASEEELMNIDGVGEGIAREIVEYARNKGFNNVSDLMNVPGIGEKRFENISPYVYVDKPAS